MTGFELKILSLARKERAMGTVYGYIRVSSRDQNEDRQMIALKELCISEKNIYWQKTRKSSSI